MKVVLKLFYYNLLTITVPMVTFESNGNIRPNNDIYFNDKQHPFGVNVRQRFQLNRNTALTTTTKKKKNTAMDKHTLFTFS